MRIRCPHCRIGVITMKLGSICSECSTKVVKAKSESLRMIEKFLGFAFKKKQAGVAHDR